MREKTTFPKIKRGYIIISLTVQQTPKDLSIYIKPLYWEMSQGKPFGSSSSQAQQRVKYFKFYSEAKPFLKFSWQPVVRRFDVCFKNLAQTDKVSQESKQTVWETKNHPWQVKFIPSLWPRRLSWSLLVQLCASVILWCWLRRPNLCVSCSVCCCLTLTWFSVAAVCNIPHLCILLMKQRLLILYQLLYVHTHKAAGYNVSKVAGKMHS